MSSERQAWFRDAFDDARREWPELVVNESGFRAYLETKVAALPDSRTFRTLRTTDLYLAFACLEADEAALLSFDDRYFPRLGRLLGQMKITPSTTDDLKGALREMLFFGKEGSAPLIGDYSGRGDLASWLRSITVRLAFKTKKKRGREVGTDGALATFAAETNPELLYLRQAHAAAFEEALTHALQALEPRERNLLRQHYLDGLGLDALGRLYRVHRATVARQIAAAREKVLDEVKHTLATRMSPSELESFLRMTRPDFNLRISTHLRIPP